MQELQKSKKRTTNGQHSCNKPSQIVVTGSKASSVRTWVSKARMKQKTVKQLPCTIRQHSCKEARWAMLETRIETIAQLSLKRAMKQQSILIYLSVGSMFTESTRLVSGWHVIKVAHICRWRYTICYCYI